VQSVLEVPPALAQPAAALIGAALTGLTSIARQSADRLLEPPLGLLARAFRSLLASASGHLGLLDQVLALGGSQAERCPMVVRAVKTEAYRKIHAR
jgi:hypothetical protein